MFSKSQDTSPTVPGVPAAPMTQPRGTSRSSGPSIISVDLIVTGTLVSTGELQIDGIVEGNVRSAGMVIGENAQVHGELLTDNIIVRGKVVGRICARKVQLAATSHVEGDILHQALAVEGGAFFEGTCRHSDDPLGEEAAKPAAEPQSAPAPSLGVAHPNFAAALPR